MNKIEQIIRLYLPKKYVYTIPILIKELEKYCQSKANESFNAGRNISSIQVGEGWEE